MTRRGWLYFLALGIIWGLPYLLIKVAVREISPPLLVLIRTGGAAAVLVPLAAARGALGPALRRWRAVLLYTVAELAIPWLFLFSAERKLPSSLSGLLTAAVPLVAALLAWRTGTDRVNGRRSIGLLLGVSGVGTLVGFGVGASQVWAVLSMFLVVVGYAVAPWIVAHHLADVPPLGVIAWSCTFCALGYAPAAALSLPGRSLSAPVVESAVGLTVVCTIVGFVFFFALIKEAGAMRATLITYVNPAVAVVLGVAVLGEPFGASTAVGFVLVLVGCVLATSRTGEAVPERQGAEPAVGAAGYRSAAQRG